MCLGRGGCWGGAGKGGRLGVPRRPGRRCLLGLSGCQAPRPAPHACLCCASKHTHPPHARRRTSALVPLLPQGILSRQPSRVKAIKTRLYELIDRATSGAQRSAAQRGSRTAGGGGGQRAGRWRLPGFSRAGLWDRRFAAGCHLLGCSRAWQRSGGSAGKGSLGTQQGPSAPAVAPRAPQSPTQNVAHSSTLDPAPPPPSLAPAEYLSAPNFALNTDVVSAINGAPEPTYAANKACKRIHARLVLRNPRVQQLALQVSGRGWGLHARLVPRSPHVQQLALQVCVRAGVCVGGWVGGGRGGV